MLLSDKSIIELCETKAMIAPFHKESISRTDDGKSINSRGSSSYGYDLSLGPTIRRMKTQQQLTEEGWSLHGYHAKQLVMDPSNFNPLFYGEVETPANGEVLLYPGEMILAVSLEHVNMPEDVSAICMQKSTIARTHVRVEVTPLEAGWSGYVTYEICNPTTHPVLLHVGQGITQALFFKGDQPCQTTYEARGGKYQHQPQEPVIPRAKAAQTRGYPYLHRQNGAVVLGYFDLPNQAFSKAHSAAVSSSIGFALSGGFNGTSPSDIAKLKPSVPGQDDTSEEGQITRTRLSKARIDVSTTEAIGVLSLAIHTDPDYAWSWICNLAMMAQDAGAPNAEANRRAANFLYNLTGYRAWAENDIYKKHIAEAEAKAQG